MKVVGAGDRFTDLWLHQRYLILQFQLLLCTGFRHKHLTDSFTIGKCPLAGNLCQLFASIRFTSFRRNRRVDFGRLQGFPPNFGENNCYLFFLFFELISIRDVHIDLLLIFVTPNFNLRRSYFYHRGWWRITTFKHAWRHSAVFFLLGAGSLDHFIVSFLAFLPKLVLDFTLPQTIFILVLFYHLFYCTWLPQLPLLSLLQYVSILFLLFFLLILKLLLVQLI